MESMDLKKKVLEEIMGLMDEKEGENLKMKSPKFMAAKIELEKPENPSEEIKEEMDGGEGEMESGSDEEMNPETIEKLLEMYKDMKG